MDIKTQVLTKVITQIINDMSHHPNWDSMMSLTNWSSFDCEINNEEITSKIQKLLQCKEYMDLIHYGNQIFDEAMTQASLDLKGEYKNSVKAFGQEQEIYYDKSRHKRTLPEHIEKNTALNQLISNAVQNLLRNFTISPK